MLAYSKGALEGEAKKLVAACLLVGELSSSLTTHELKDISCIIATVASRKKYFNRVAELT